MSMNHKKDSSQNDTSIRKLPAEEPLGVLEPVAYFYGAMPTGLSVSQQGRIFVNFPKWGDDVQFTKKGRTFAVNPTLCFGSILALHQSSCAKTIGILLY